MLLSEHCHIQPSEWDLMPYSQMQSMISSKLSNSNKSNDTSQQQDDIMFKSQKAMLSNMKNSMKAPQFKLPKFKL